MLNTPEPMSESLFQDLKAKESFEFSEPEVSCKSCHGITGKVVSLFPKLQSRLEKIEFSTFLIGIRIHKKLQNLDEKFDSNAISVVPFKQFMTSYFVDNITSNLNKFSSQELPDVTIVIDVKRKPRFNLDIRSIYILGKYQKLARGIPQTKWPCSKCKGKKCESCNFTGQQYPSSVETIIANPFVISTKSLSSSFHGAGREDIDALMLGSGRPFVLELKQPLVRQLNIEALVAAVNNSDKVQINNLGITEKSTVALLKNSSPHSKKQYRAKIQIDKLLSDDDFNNLATMGLKPTILKQQTPLRVSHRRADKIREKTIYEFRIEEYDKVTHILTINIEAQGGAYIKEFISGDNGRTKPSIAEFINQSAECLSLDVMKVDDKGLFNLG